MTQHIKGQGRHQVTLLPEALDDFVTEDNPVRVVDIFVDGLQLDALGFERVNAKQTGRPGYHWLFAFNLPCKCNSSLPLVAYLSYH